MTHNVHTLDGVNQDLTTEYPTRDAYLELVRSWQDPNPAPEIWTYTLPDLRRIHVVRDDVLEFGSKSRFADFFIQNLDAAMITYAQPRVGYAGITLSYLGARYGKSVVLYYPAYKGPLSPHLQKCQDLGATLIPKKIYGMNGLRKAARDHAEQLGGCYLPPGLRSIPEITAAAVKVATNLAIPPDVTEVWTVISTGQLHRALQIAWPHLRFVGVAFARNLKQGEVGHDQVYSHPFPYLKEEASEHLPPFPSARAYDAKAWRFIKDHAANGALFWNVAGY